MYMSIPNITLKLVSYIDPEPGRLFELTMDTKLIMNGMTVAMYAKDTAKKMSQ